MIEAVEPDAMKNLAIGLGDVTEVSR